MTPFATYIIESLVTLLAVIALAALTLFGARRFGVGRATGPVQLVGRLPLEGRRAIYLVRVLDRVFVLGGSEAGLEKIAEVDGAAFVSEHETKLTFRQALSHVLQGERNGRQEPTSSRMSEGNDARE